MILINFIFYDILFYDISIHFMYSYLIHFDVIPFYKIFVRPIHALWYTVYISISYTVIPLYVCSNNNDS